MSVKEIIKKILLKNRIYSADINSNRSALVLYIIDPFIRKVPDVHQNLWQVTEIVTALNEMGYNTDVIDYNNYYVKLKKNYDLILDICPLEHPVYKDHMTPDCKRIAYFTGSNSSFANAAEMNRLDELLERRGIRIQPRRQAPLTPKIIEEFDAHFAIGNDYNMQTYHREFNLPHTYLIPNTGYDFGGKFDTEELISSGKRSPINFLYFGSLGCVHKGLDRLLEIFSEPGFPCNLYVCGLFKKEKDFEKAYHKELYETKNIFPIGFLNIDSPQFKEIADLCAFTLLPSCSEGMAGSINTAMSAGIIPICSRECGFNSDEAVLLDDCSISTIRSAILKYSRSDIDWVRNESKRMLEISGTRYSKAAFSKAIRAALDEVVKG